MSVTVSVELITPDMAAVWLSQNTDGQRSLSLKRRDDLADAIKSGLWQLNGESIVFSADEKLLDGQHRLSAVVAAGVAILSVVVRGVDEETFSTIDTGKKRTSGDILHMAGINNANAVASATALLWRYANELMQDRKHRPSHNTVLRISKFMPEIIPIVSDVYRCDAIKRMCFPSVTCAAFVLFELSGKSQELKEFKSLLSGEKAMDRTSVVFLLRERLHANRAAKAKLYQEDLLALFIRAWDYFLVGKRVTFLRWADGQSFPVVPGCSPKQLKAILDKVTQ